MQRQKSICTEGGGQIIAVTLLISLFLVFSYCTKIPHNPQSNQLTTNTTTTAEMTVVDNGTQLLLAVTDMAKQMAENAQQTVDGINKSGDEAGTISKLSLEHHYPAKVRVTDEFTADWYLEKSFLSKASAKQGEAVLFAPDPDVFKSEKEEHNCDAFLWQDGIVSKVSFTVEEYESKWSAVPLFLLSYKCSSDGSGKNLQKVAAVAGDWAVLYAIKQKTNMETWGSMEIMISTQQQAGEGYAAYDLLVFDGTTHDDYAGRPRYHPDVNTAGSKYDITGGIAVVYAGNSSNHGWVVEENDYGYEDVLNMDHPTPFPYDLTAFGYSTVDVNPANSGRVDNQTRKFWYNTVSTINSDDIAKSGCYEGYDTSWSLAYNTEHEEALDDNHFWLKRENL